ncbi:DUF4344 domain-containing metallopeptidase [uncultured Tateyamaria sp.]|uniref:DUF4344 domain-containing metallopeptidase n=1 Tax=uncultured Tateyamaria sp. TaxID=455651 RepID=UPI0026298B12|nr:DUF4344 domain-containing metallopeptidase [uncultured Tateyamaria sp.]
MRIFPHLIAVLTITSATPAQAQDLDERQAFIEANILSIFYHELGHAVIDLMEVPIFGQEEDAADVMSVLMIDWLFDEDTAQAIAYDSAFGFINDPDQTEEVPYWDLHGPDEQRYYNHVCLFYGANPDARDDLAVDLGLPEGRAETCVEEYEQAAYSWGIIFDEMDDQRAGVPMIFRAGSGDGATLLNEVLAAEVASMNGDIRLPQEVVVTVSSCGEPNAFYDPQEISVTFCTEFIPHLEDLHAAWSQN